MFSLIDPIISKAHAYGIQRGLPCRSTAANSSFYKSAVLATINMTNIPLALVGAVVGLWLSIAALWTSSRWRALQFATAS